MFCEMQYIITMKIEFKYKFGEEVHIKPLELNGYMDGVTADASGEMYKVVYWFNGERKAVYVDERDIEKCTTKVPLKL